MTTPAIGLRPASATEPQAARSSGASASSASSGAASADATSAAHQHAAHALDLYRQGSYHEAITELETALKLDPNGKDLVFNLGVVHEKLGDIEDALRYFQRYEQMDLEPQERAKAEAYVKRLQGARREVEKPPEPPPPRSPLPSPPSATPTRAALRAVRLGDGERGRRGRRRARRRHRLWREGARQPAES